jgi:hypothetical protein
MRRDKCSFILVLLVLVTVVFFMSATAIAGEEEPLEKRTDAATIATADEEEFIKNGTDPRDLDRKFTPFYRYTKLKGGTDTQELIIKGLQPFADKKWGLGGELPLFSYRDPDSDMIDDKAGMGDLKIRLTTKKPLSKLFTFVPILETTLPTATEEILGEKKWIMSPSPGIVFHPKPWFIFAPLPFYDFSVAGDKDRADVNRLRWRIFFMVATPMGVYFLPETVWTIDFEDDNEHSLSVSPEVGFMWEKGKTVYAKPGFGIEPDRDEVENSIEVGFRITF